MCIRDSFLLSSPGGKANFAVQGMTDGVTYKAFSDPTREFALTLPRTQDYLISLNGPAFINYTLEVTVLSPGATPTPTAAPVTPERITFPPGATSAARSGSLWANTPRAYVFGAAAGQTARIRFNSPSPAAAFAVRGVSDGVQYKYMADPARDWSFTLPLNQDYLSTIQAPVSYTHLDVYKRRALAQPSGRSGWPRVGKPTRCWASAPTDSGGPLPAIWGCSHAGSAPTLPLCVRSLSRPRLRRPIPRDQPHRLPLPSASTLARGRHRPSCAGLSALHRRRSTCSLPRAVRRCACLLYTSRCV